MGIMLHINHKKLCSDYLDIMIHQNYLNLHSPLFNFISPKKMTYLYC